MSEEALPKNEWLTTEQVRTMYGFDPSPYVERSHKHYISNQLQPVRCGGCLGFTRLWLKAFVESEAEAIREINEEHRRIAATPPNETIKQRCERDAREGLARK